MKIIRTLLTPLPQKTIITIGNFDALHQGHQHLLDELIEKSKKQKLMSLVMTFEPLPSEFFSTHPPARLSSFKEKCLYLKKWNLDYLICLRFNKALANLSAVDFVKTILIEKLNMKHLIIGEGFRFAYQRQGDSALLQKLSTIYAFRVDILPARFYQHHRVSSTGVREALAQNQFELVHALLDRPYTLSGHVAHGKKRGRDLGFPTANIHLHRKKLPLEGVYIVKVHGLDTQALPGVANIGHRPSIDNIPKPLLEIHLLNYHQNLYGRSITVEFIKKLRDEKKFQSIEKLKQQIHHDIEETKRFFT